MISIRRCWSGECVARSILRKSPRKASSFASIFAAYPNPATARAIGVVLRPEDIEVCLKAPARDVDVAIAADLDIFTKVWLGYIGLVAGLEGGQVSLQGSVRAMRTARRLLALPDQPKLKSFRFSTFPPSRAVAAE